MRSAFVSPSFLVSDSSGGSPPLNFPDTENLCKVCVTGTDHPPPLLEMWMTSHGQCPRGVLVNVQEWGCFSIFRRADDVTRTMSKGGCLWMSSPPPPLQEILYPRLDRDTPPPKLYPISPTASDVASGGGELFFFASFLVRTSRNMILSLRSAVYNIYTHNSDHSLTHSSLSRSPVLSKYILVMCIQYNYTYVETVWMYVGMYVCVCMCVCMYVYVCVCMYVCMCLCVSMYVCPYVCIHVCMYTVCIHTMYVYMHVCMCVYVCVYTVCIHVCMCMYVGMCVYVCMCVCVYVCPYVCIHVCMYTVCIHVCVCMYVCMYVCMHAYIDGRTYV